MSATTKLQHLLTKHLFLLLSLTQGFIMCLVSERQLLLDQSFQGLQRGWAMGVPRFFEHKCVQITCHPSNGSSFCGPQVRCQVHLLWVLREGTDTYWLFGQTCNAVGRASSSLKLQRSCKRLNLLLGYHYNHWRPQVCQEKTADLCGSTTYVCSEFRAK